jgi:hypothetical protein
MFGRTSQPLAMLCVTRSEFRGREGRFSRLGTDCSDPLGQTNGSPFSAASNPQINAAAEQGKFGSVEAVAV